MKPKNFQLQKSNHASVRSLGVCLGKLKRGGGGHRGQEEDPFCHARTRREREACASTTNGSLACCNDGDNNHQAGSNLWRCLYPVDTFVSTWVHMGTFAPPYC